MDKKSLSPETSKKRADSRRKSSANCCIQEILIELMNDWKVELATIQKETGIPWGTLYGFYKGDIKAPILNGNILALANFFNCSISYLAFGIGEEPERPKVVAPEFDQAAKNREARMKIQAAKELAKSMKRHSENSRLKRG